MGQKTTLPQSLQATTKTITLSTPLKYGDKELNSFEIRSPNAGEMRGIKIQNLGWMDPDELIKLLPRITFPVLAEAQLVMLTAPDVMKIYPEVLDFFQVG